MDEAAQGQEVRFPWGYALATLIPFVFIGGTFLCSIMIHMDKERPMHWVGITMLVGMLVPASAAIVVAYGICCLAWGEGRRYPALRWLVFIPVFVGFTAILMG